MGARGRRDELIALIALVLLAVAITGVIAFIEPDRTPAVQEQPQDPSEPSDPSSSPSVDEPSEPTGVRLWDEPFVYACQLLPPDDVERIFGPSGLKGYVRQQYLDRTPTTAELDGASAFAYGGLSTRCTHWFDDKAGHQLDVVVTQFPTTRSTERRWSRLEKTGRPVPGSEGRMLRLPDEGAFVVRAGDLIVELTYAADRKDGNNPQVPLMLDALASINLHRGDDSAIEGPLPTTAGVTGTVGGTPYLEACAVLDSSAFEALDGPPAEPVVVDTSVIPHDLYADAAVSNCERSATFRDKGPRKVLSTFAVLELRVAPDPTAAQGVLERHLDNRYPARTKIREIETDAGTAYVVTVPPTKRDRLHTRVVHVVVGAYELRLAAVRDVGPQQKAGRAPTDAQLTAAVEALADSLDEALEESSSDVP